MYNRAKVAAWVLEHRRQRREIDELDKLTDEQLEEIIHGGE